MSLNQPANKEELKEFCLRQLGWPVIQINVDDEQVNDAVELALEYWNEFHFNGTERTYVKHQVTAQDMTNKYVTVSENLIGATRVFKVGQNKMAMNMFDLRYQLRLHELYDFTSTSYVSYTLTQQHIRTLDLLFSGETPIRFNRHTDRLYIDWDWDSDIEAGEYIIIEGYIIIDPETYVDIYNDRMLKKLATAYIKRQWGANMSKFAGMQLPGGLSFNGQAIYDEATAERKDLEYEMVNSYSLPVADMIG